MNTKQILSSLFVMLLALTSYAQDTASLGETLKKAKKENKLVFVDCYFTGCHPCAEMDRDVFPNPTVKAEVDRSFLLLKANIFTDKVGDTLKVQYILNGFPTFLILNGDGELISTLAGFKDAGELLAIFKDAQEKAKQGKFLAGYSSKFSEQNYPDFYVNYCKTRKGLTQDIITNYSSTVKDFKSKNALMPYLVSHFADDKAADKILADYEGFANLYGEYALQPVIDNILIKKVNEQYKSNPEVASFNALLAAEKSKFPAKQWKVCLQTLGSRYYLALKKDTTAYLNFAIQNPVLYQNYFGALYSNVVARGGLTKERIDLFSKLSDAIVTEESGLEFIKLAARMHKDAKDEAGYNKFTKMALAYTKKFQMSPQLQKGSGAK